MEKTIMIPKEISTKEYENMLSKLPVATRDNVISVKYYTTKPVRLEYENDIVKERITGKMVQSRKVTHASLLKQLTYGARLVTSKSNCDGTETFIFVKDAHNIWVVDNVISTSPPFVCGQIANPEINK
jgi:hypothetical protein